MVVTRSSPTRPASSPASSTATSTWSPPKGSPPKGIIAASPLPSCIPCTFTAASNCSFCLRAKLSPVPRMHLKELGSRMIKETPGLTCEELLRFLCDYARSTRFAILVNKRLAWPRSKSAKTGSRSPTGLRSPSRKPTSPLWGQYPQDLCDHHYDEWSDLQDCCVGLQQDLTNQRVLVETAHQRLSTMQEEITEAKQRCSEAEKSAARVTRELGRIRLKSCTASANLKMTKSAKANDQLAAQEVYKEAAALRRNLEDAQRRIAEQDKRLADLEDDEKESELMALADELEDAKRQIARLRIQSKEKDRRLLRLRSGHVDGATTADASSVGANNDSLPLPSLPGSPKAGGFSHATGQPGSPKASDAPPDLNLGEEKTDLQTLLDRSRDTSFANQHTATHPLLGPFCHVRFGTSTKGSLPCLPLEPTLLALREITESLCIDKERVEVSDPRSAIEELVEQIYLVKFGLQRVADRKLRQLFNSCDKWADSHPAIGNLRLMLGIQDPRCFSPIIATAAVALISEAWKVDSDTLARLFSADEHAVAVLDPVTLDKLLADDPLPGKRTPLSSTSSLAQILGALASKSEIDSAMNTIRTRAKASAASKQEGTRPSGTEPPSMGDGLKETSGPLDVAEMWQGLLRYMLVWLDRARGALNDAFLTFDADQNGLELPEFQVMISDFFDMDLPKKDVVRYWRLVAAAMGARDGVLGDPLLFASACLQLGLVPPPDSGLDEEDSEEDALEEARVSSGGKKSPGADHRLGADTGGVSE